jgi:rod shape-determining protein MreD
MRYCFYIGACLLLIIFQTTVLPYLTVFDGIYDLLIPFVIFLSICLPARESLPFILALGFMMDNISGSPFGLYLTVYFWLFVGVCWIARYLRMRNKIFLSFVVVAAVLIENVFVIGTFAVFRPSWQLPAEAVKNIVLQLIWALATGPIFLFGLLWVSKRLNIQLNGATAQPDA